MVMLSLFHPYTCCFPKDYRRDIILLGICQLLHTCTLITSCSAVFSSGWVEESLLGNGLFGTRRFNSDLQNLR